KKSCLKEAFNVLKNIDYIAIIRLNDRDVVRHRLVQKIINAYNDYKDKRENNNAKNKG
ncbi:MAG: PhoH family protein, partial [Clostridia bacterium]|nr:PhoH family protein [Clostridia bacterium]